MSGKCHCRIQSQTLLQQSWNMWSASISSVLLATCVTFSCIWETTTASTTQVANSAIGSRDSLRSRVRSMKASDKSDNRILSTSCAGCMPDLCFPASGCAACDFDQGWLPDGSDGCTRGEHYDSQLLTASSIDSAGQLRLSIYPQIGECTCTCRVLHACVCELHCVVDVCKITFDQSPCCCNVTTNWPMVGLPINLHLRQLNIT